MPRFTSQRLSDAQHKHERAARLNAVRQVTSPQHQEWNITPANVADWREKIFEMSGGQRIIKMMRNMVLLVTDPTRRVTDGGIILPASVAGFYAGMPKGKYATGVALLCGPEVDLVKEGERIMFPRINFTWTRKLPDEMLLGWIPEGEIWGVIEPEGE